MNIGKIFHDKPNSQNFIKLKSNFMKWTLFLCLSLSQNIIENLIKPVNASGVQIEGMLQGIGYREPDL
jgi:hypothetical protein